MGVLQALEAIKLIAAAKPPSSSSSEDISSSTSPSFSSSSSENPNPTLLLFSAYSTPPFRTVRLRSRRADCAVCSAHATITASSLTSGSMDYITFCGGAPRPANILPASARISAADFARLPRDDGSNTLIDVRDETQFGMCALRGSVNVPWTGDGGSWLEAVGRREEIVGAAGAGAGVSGGGARAFYVVCRMGNDSQLAAKALLENAPGLAVGGVWHIEGGFRAWREGVDAGWPEY